MLHMCGYSPTCIFLEDSKLSKSGAVEYRRTCYWVLGAAVAGGDGLTMRKIVVNGALPRYRPHAGSSGAIRVISYSCAFDWSNRARREFTFWWAHGNAYTDEDVVSNRRYNDAYHKKIPTIFFHVGNLTLALPYSLLVPCATRWNF